MKQAKFGSSALAAAILLAAMVSCDGSTKVASQGVGSSKPVLQKTEIGRLVDIYAYQRIDPAVGDRRNRANRRAVLVAENVVVNPNLESQSLFDAAGEEVLDANFEFRPFDKRAGHEELVILWDNRAPAEAARFQTALAACQEGLLALPPSYRGQNTQTRPIPVVPRNAALRLTFSGELAVDAEFFRVNPSAIQVLEFKGDPAVVQPADAFRIVPVRVLPQGNRIVIDTTILGGEAVGGFTSAGLPASSDSVTANIRIAMPSRGAAAANFFIAEDPVQNLNGIDSEGRPSVIRDFRSGNLADGPAGRLREPEAPMVVGSLGMGITAIDATTNTVTINKRNRFVPVRGRYPFVDGPLSANGLPVGPAAVPTARPLAAGDVLAQTIQVQMPDGTFESVELRAEILQNLEVGTVVGDPALPRLGRTENAFGGSDQGERIPVVRVRVASLAAGFDSLGRPHTFRASTAPLGEDCVLEARYYDNVPFAGANVAVSDRDWRFEFLRIDPLPPAGSPPATLVATNASVAIEFTKPMDLDQVDNTANLLITNTSVATESFAVQMGDPKRATLRVVPTRLSDVGGDGTILRLQPPIGFFHASGTAEVYAFHIRTGAAGVTDLAGNPLALFDTAANPQDSWSVDFTLNPAASSNLVGWHSWLFEALDEDGTLPGSVDAFGQYQLQGGRLFGAPGVRFSRTADNQNLPGISRVNRGECWDSTQNLNLFFDPAAVIPTDQNGAPHPGLLYWQPRMFTTEVPPNVPQVYEFWQQLPQNVGRVVEPHSKFGSRMQMRYIEDDFSLSYREPSEFGLDIEQLYWSPFNDETVFFDVFDRYSMSLAHSGRRPDIRVQINPGNPTAMPPVPPFCQWACPTNNSALSQVFSENVLAGTQAVPVFEDRVYTINPNQAFRSPQGVKYVPYPRFDRSYTWRDSRLVTVDASGNVIGLGGARQPNAPEPNNDFTANIDSPWITSVPDAEFVNGGGTTWVMDEADFVGNRQLDHDPIALPLLVDFKVFPDGSANGVAAGSNSFQMALLGPPSNNPLGPNFTAGGYYDQWPAGCAPAPAWPWTRVHATGGENIISGAAVLIDPANQLAAQPSFVKDAGLGNATRALFQAPPGDGMVSWARADFVRKVSTVTFGFLDTLRPQMFRIATFDQTGTPTVATGDGFPNLLAVNPNLRISDLVVQTDPPQSRQPAGTSVVVELRGAESFTNSGVLYNPTFNQAAQTADDTFNNRGNLLNPNYACEAYRYSTNNGAGGVARIPATGLTRYVTDDQLGLIRDPATGLLPRFLNLRLVMTNNVDVSPALSPSLRSMSVVYRMQPNQ